MIFTVHIIATWRKVKNRMLSFFFSWRKMQFELRSPRTSEKVVVCNLFFSAQHPKNFSLFCFPVTCCLPALTKRKSSSKARVSQYQLISHWQIHKSFEFSMTSYKTFFIVSVFSADQITSHRIKPASANLHMHSALLALLFLLLQTGHFHFAEKCLFLWLLAVGWFENIVCNLK